MIWPRTIACDAALSKASIQQLSLTFRTSSSEAARRRYLLVSTRIFRLRGSGAPAGSAMLVGWGGCWRKYCVSSHSVESPCCREPRLPPLLSTALALRCRLAEAREPPTPPSRRLSGSPRRASTTNPRTFGARPSRKKKRSISRIPKWSPVRHARRLWLALFKIASSLAAQPAESCETENKKLPMQASGKYPRCKLGTNEKASGR